MKILRCVKLNFLQWRINPKYFICLLFVVLDIWYMLHGIQNYAQHLGYGVRPYLLALLPGANGHYMIVLFISILLVSDAPFCNGQQQFILLRIGKRNWMAGQLLYLFCVSALYISFLWILSVIFLLPNISFGKTWGHVIQTAAQKQDYFTFAPAISISYNCIKNVTPAEAMLWFMGMFLAVHFLLSEIVLLCNLWTKGGVGTVIAMCFILITYLIRQLSAYTGFQRFLIWISPVSWLDRALLGHTNQNLPSYAFATCTVVVLAVALAAIALITVPKCSLDTSKE